jgi:hypothetical protein
MTRKATHPCSHCGRRLKTHRGKRAACSKTCRDALRAEVKSRRHLARNKSAQP